MSPIGIKISMNIMKTENYDTSLGTKNLVELICGQITFVFIYIDIIQLFPNSMPNNRLQCSLAAQTRSEFQQEQVIKVVYEENPRMAL